MRESHAEVPSSAREEQRRITAGWKRKPRKSLCTQRTVKKEVTTWAARVCCLMSNH